MISGCGCPYYVVLDMYNFTLLEEEADEASVEESKPEAAKNISDFEV